MQEQTNYKPKKKNKGGSRLQKLIFSIITKVIFSPLLVFGISYIYFEQDIQKASLATLYFYTAFTVLSIGLKLLGILTSAMTFRFIKFIKRSIDLVIMAFMLVVYWFMYSLAFGTNFQLF